MSSVFILFILMLASSLCMYSAEHEAQPDVFNNAFSGLWWSISTILTVGYGDIFPITVLGRCMGIVISILGVGVVAIPTGIISAGFVEQYTQIQKSTANKQTPKSTTSIVLDSKHAFINNAIQDMERKMNISIIVVVRDGTVMLPVGQTRLVEGDTVVYQLLED